MQLRGGRVRPERLRPEGANSSEFDPETSYPVIDLLPDQEQITEKGGTMRLGPILAALQEGTLAHLRRQEIKISERHRHRLKSTINTASCWKRGIVFSGHSPDARLVEIMELPGHPWFMGCQFHPELKSRPHSPAHPLFREFIHASLKEKRKKRRKTN